MLSWKLCKKRLEEAGRKVCFLGEGSSNKSDCEEKRQADRDRKVGEIRRNERERETINDPKLTKGLIFYMLLGSR